MFCPYCGAKLEEGQQCTCPQAQQEQQKQERPQDPAYRPISGYQPISGFQPISSSRPSSGYQPSSSYQPNSDYQSRTDYQPGDDSPSGPEDPANTSSQPDSQKRTEKQQPFSQVGKQMRNVTAQAAKNFKPFLSQYFSNPIAATRAAVEHKNVSLAVTLAVIRLLTVVFLVLSISAKLVDTVMSGLSFLGSILSMVGLGFGDSGSPFLCILYGILVAFIGVALFTLSLFALTQIFKSGGNFLGVFIANSVNGIVMTALLLLALVLSFLSLSLALGLVVMACLTAVVMGWLSARAVCPGQESGAFLFSYLGCILVVLIISWLVVPDILLRAVAAMF